MVRRSRMRLATLALVGVDGHRKTYRLDQVEPASDRTLASRSGVR
jgi:hypothetical protein